MYILISLASNCPLKNGTKNCCLKQSSTKGANSQSYYTLASTS